ncbi:methane monooxygenase/ammonia monooxygenase subunit C [Rhodococcus oxybenzonivorans]|uniref:methane monooxygenase/ammonia monooxygenase subunit C n=1 Tax=Rhodococcus TaxID=1827 RepID=UPI00132048A2|nr:MULTISPECIES: methane monooxygenase/ammonia monooxygenase subunit C [Rhodococcus]MDV7348096.1 methane monooxygenase/ammonia monooxygenase subunit C [Rhodococcus oxybenzonivorans]QHE73982.1 Particulate methane monooxygenase C-subunit [Rhodococcus sp. WAY2]
MTTAATRRSRTARSGSTSPVDHPAPVSRGGSIFSIVLAVMSVLALALVWRTYQQIWALENGLDSHDPDFNKYWLSLAAANMILLPSAAALWYAWMWTSARRLPKEMTRKEEGRRLWNLWLLVAVFTTAVFFGGSYAAEQDASWHQIVTRDTAFTPSHDVLFYGAFPLMIYLSAGVYLYGRTRLPHIYGGKRLPVSFAMIVGGSLLLLFQVAMNEFGHSFFQAEEVFAAPLHWPFVIFAYLLAATFAIWFETLPRIFELARQERELSIHADESPSEPAVATMSEPGDTIVSRR